MNKNPQLLNKICLVTGANKGIGLAITEKLLEEGAIVYANVRSQEVESIEIKELTSEYSSLHVIYFDLLENTQVENSVKHIRKNKGRIDVLINNAGIVSYEILGMIDVEEITKMFQVNVLSVISLIQSVSRIMKRNGSGSIVNISSIVGVKGAAGQLAYSATKGALNSITLSAAKELAPHRIKVNAIAPGMVGTKRLKDIAESKFPEKLNDIPFGRMAEPEEIAGLCSFLASDQSSYCTGQIIGIDGGMKL